MSSRLIEKGTSTAVSVTAGPTGRLMNVVGSLTGATPPTQPPCVVVAMEGAATRSVSRLGASYTAIIEGRTDDLAPQSAAMDSQYHPKRLEGEIQRQWAQSRAFAAPDVSPKPKYFCVSMLPYP